ncbi:helix-turn-helix transcriptional regulator [Casimicrobium huifangae]|jgi:predicted DNA-binding transcriptional regulator YafY|uniref:helix-turn-helix transcriptional regulator n=1 Tax=Casimicrobium huifangae TaxID=2591109 RepID=UPI0012EC42C5|nr:YafY family protein [Casimicrobium huifangae]
MRRADRLFRIVQFLRGRRLTTAQQLAKWLQVSERTVYRDIRDLSLTGTPIEGEAGVGYRLRGGFELPPLMFELEEIEALTLGARMVEAWSSPQLGAAALSAIAKIATALPVERRQWLEASRTYVPQFHIPKQLGERFELLRGAIRDRRKVHFVYADVEKKLSERRVRPLSLYFWGEHWTLAAWCEARDDFRSFRIDRVIRLQVTDDVFDDEAGKRIADYVRAQQVAAAAWETSERKANH